MGDDGGIDPNEMEAATASGSGSDIGSFERQWSWSVGFQGVAHQSISKPNLLNQIGLLPSYL